MKDDMKKLTLLVSAIIMSLGLFAQMDIPYGLDKHVDENSIYFFENFGFEELKTELFFINDLVEEEIGTVNLEKWSSNKTYKYRASRMNDIFSGLISVRKEFDEIIENNDSIKYSVLLNTIGRYAVADKWVFQFTSEPSDEYKEIEAELTEHEIASYKLSEHLLYALSAIKFPDQTDGGYETGYLFLLKLKCDWESVWTEYIFSVGS
jgi:hypothetical protein